LDLHAPGIAVDTAFLRASHCNNRKYRAFYKWFIYRKPKNYIKLWGWKGRYFTGPSDGCYFPTDKYFSQKHDCRIPLRRSRCRLDNNIKLNLTEIL
jgi:hypothetical protein